MPWYHYRIIVKEIDRGGGFPAEDIEEAKIRLEEEFERAISERTVVCEVIK